MRPFNDGPISASMPMSVRRGSAIPRIGCNEEDDSDGGCPSSDHRTRSVMAARSEAKFPPWRFLCTLAQFS